MAEKENVVEVKEEQKVGVPVSDWPLTQSAREAVVTNIIKNLSTPSILTRRYGYTNEEKAALTAHDIEQQAFAAASGAGLTNGTEILRFYSELISEKMLESVNQ
ncbi:hypothetical protein C5167_007527 [Papaver somniferum]|uniref:MFP1 attachment factor 1-like n=1 Tax=Papaver somniferum TaxID=3469 RepID=UPI000E705756|nr:MFP1 attachment factor 1-like [Papaver somniferum]RZC86340.1 hypothetical protein C5167_007527 [Papaver somniferum]